MSRKAEQVNESTVREPDDTGPHSQHVGEERAETRPRLAMPGWPELLAGGAAYAVSYLLVVVLLPLIDGEAVAGVVGFVVSGAMGVVALAVAASVRIRGLGAFGIRRARPRHVLAGASLGLIAFLLGIAASALYTSVTGDSQNVQVSYQSAAATGWVTLVLTLVGGSVVTPVGEEAFFRGVVANALVARHGAWIGIAVSAAVFALAHGVNPVLPVAFVVGVLTGLLFRRTGSIWPGVALHGVNNATATLVPLILAAVAS